MGFNRIFRDGSGFDTVLVLLALGYLLAFSAFPLIYNLVISFQSVDLFTIATFDRPFVGLQNYAEIIEDPLFWPIVRNTAVFVLLSVVFQLTIGFALALFFRLDFPGRDMVARPVSCGMDHAGTGGGCHLGLDSGR